jgi:hypothetical protein
MMFDIRKMQNWLREPLPVKSRLLLLAGILLALFVFCYPLWTMSFQSNQYPDALKLAIHINYLEGQKTQMRDDLREINSLNHYIGMRPLLESDFSEFLWLPFMVGFFILATLRAAVFGCLRDLVDIGVLYIYFGMFSAWTFYGRLYEYGHNLNPEAAIKVPPFTPPFFGQVQIANFWVESFPGGGTVALGLYGLFLIVAFMIALHKLPQSSGVTVEAR